MAEYNKERYYWIKLKQSLMTSKAVDFLMSQKDGANYVVLYQCLCLKTINQNGELADRIGEIIVPFDENKIQRETKWFSLDTIRVAMTLYKRLGLIYEQSDGTLKISNFEDLVGSQTISAHKKQLQIKARVGNGVEQKVEKIPPDNKSIDNKILDIRDKDIDIDKDEDKEFDGETFADDLKYFLDKWHIQIDDYNGNLSEFDFEKLDKAYSNSVWLQNNFTVTSKICRNYQKIITGKYNDEVKTKLKSKTAEEQKMEEIYKKYPKLRDLENQKE